MGLFKFKYVFQGWIVYFAAMPQFPQPQLSPEVNADKPDIPGILRQRPQEWKLSIDPTSGGISPVCQQDHLWWKNHLWFADNRYEPEC